MTVYAELLKMALAEEDEPGRTIDQMVSEALARRQALVRYGDAATRLAGALAYDSILVHLCQALGVEHDLTSEEAGPKARARAEQVLAIVLPVPGSPGAVTKH